ncbi:unnamed protein product [Cyclocybe aegerita]|uniref:DUF6593 domain-containing protein n=1 Tax=Cyclocybe aegerita TaxID=1973307 RepID=A0A8S0WXJ0_CYCAE|nr:unnamed protein product [Cyclocybe aegerita]
MLVTGDIFCSMSIANPKQRELYYLVNGRLSKSEDNRGRRKLLYEGILLALWIQDMSMRWRRPSPLPPHSITISTETLGEVVLSSFAFSTPFYLLLRVMDLSNSPDKGSDANTIGSQLQSPPSSPNAEQTSSTMFPSASDIGIRGGQFNAAQTIINTTNNYHYADSDPSLTSSGAVPVGAATSLPAPGGNKLQRQEHRTTMEDIQSRPRLNPLPVQRSCEIYYRNLATQGRGSPLWIPESNNRLPIDYQRKGIAIGDVGILTPSGAFDFLFNICLPPDHIFNEDRTPPGFSPLDPPLKDIDVHGYTEFKADSYLTSSSIEKSYRDDNRPGLTFESSASEGAILTMPHGAQSENLGNVSRFRKYMADNQESWYEHVNGELGREAQNGDIRLVIGCDKSVSWGMAIFANVRQQNGFRLNFRPVGETIVGRTYGWEYTGMAQVKAGPDLQDIRELNDDESGEITIYRNQCLFVRTLNATLHEEAWERLDSASTVPESVKLGRPARPPFGPAQFPVATMNNSSKTPTGSQVATGSQMGIETSETSRILPLPITSHPSSLLNSVLLQQRPNAKIAITEDKDWISILRKGETALPDSQEFIRRVLEMNEVQETDGVVFLEPKVPKTTEPVTQEQKKPVASSLPSSPPTRMSTVAENPTKVQIAAKSNPGATLPPSIASEVTKNASISLSSHSAVRPNPTSPASLHQVHSPQGGIFNTTVSPTWAPTTSKSLSAEQPAPLPSSQTASSLNTAVINWSSPTVSGPTATSSRIPAEALALSPSSTQTASSPVLVPLPRIAPQSDNILLWTNQDSRESILFNFYGIAYRFQTSVLQGHPAITTMWRTIRLNKEDRIARLEWAPNGGLGRVVVGKNTLGMADLLKADLGNPGMRYFSGPDGCRYYWRHPQSSMPNLSMYDTMGNVVAFFRQTRQVRYQMGDVYGELHLIPVSSGSTVPMMDMIVLTAMLNRVCAAFNL